MCSDFTLFFPLDVMQLFLRSLSSVIPTLPSLNVRELL